MGFEDRKFSSKLIPKMGLIIVLIGALLVAGTFYLNDSIINQSHEIPINSTQTVETSHIIPPQGDFIENRTEFDVSGLSSPFYSGFYNGLLDLLGNIPDPKEQVAFIKPVDGGPFDYKQDRYLYRWKVAETYDLDLNDFDQGYNSTQLDYIDSSGQYNSRTGYLDQARAFRIQEQYLTISSIYVGDVLVPWNSELGGMIGSTNNVVSIVDATITGELIEASVSGYRDVNEQPVLSMEFTESRSKGFMEYDAYFVEEDKEYISDNAMLMTDIEIINDNYDQIRFGDLSSLNANGISGIWGLESLPGRISYAQQSGDGKFFSNKFNEYKTLLQTNPDINVYKFITAIYNDIQNAVIQGILGGYLNIDPTQTSGVVEEGADKSYWFYRALAEPNVEFGMKELITGFTNMLRSFDIPARPVLGFSIGNFLDADGDDCTGNDCSEISILFQHLHAWIEVMIPVEDPNNLNSRTYHWGIFNPIPDPWILQNNNTDFAFGRNSLGSILNVTINVLDNKGSILTIPVDLETTGAQLPFMPNKTDQNWLGHVEDHPQFHKAPKNNRCSTYRKIAS